MTFRTTVQDGVVFFNTHGQIPDGTPVDIVPRPKQSKAVTQKTSTEQGLSSPKRPTPKRTTMKASRPPVRSTNKARGKSGESALKAFQKVSGIWAGRPEWAGKSGVEIAKELRDKSMRGLRG